MTTVQPTPFETHRSDIDRCVSIIRAAIAAEARRLKEAPSLSLDELVNAYATAREFHDLIDEVKKEQYHNMNAYKESVIPARLLEQGVKSYSTDKWRVSRLDRVSVSMKDGEACLQWLRDNELGDIIKESASVQTLGKIADEWADQGRDFPEDLFDTKRSMSTSLTATKKTAKAEKET